MTFKDALYESYVSSHIAGRKGSATVADLPRRVRVFDQHFGAFLPTRKDARIADLGCGPGTLVWWLQQRGYVAAQGVDGSAEQVAVAHELGVSAVRHGDIFTFLAAETGFDLLFARDVIEHFEKQEVYDFLRAAYASLAPGGQLVLQVPNAASPYFGRVRYGDFTHELAFTSGSLDQLFRAVGFTRTRVQPWRPGITGPKSRLRYVAWRMIEPFLKLPALIETGSTQIVTMNLIAVAEKSN